MGCSLLFITVHFLSNLKYRFVVGFIFSNFILCICLLSFSCIIFFRFTLLYSLINNIIGIFVFSSSIHSFLVQQNQFEEVARRNLVLSCLNNNFKFALEVNILCCLFMLLIHQIIYYVKYKFRFFNMNRR